MFLSEFLENGNMPEKIFPKLAMESCTYQSFYTYWIDQLFERVMRLFVWENTGEVKPKEIEQRLLLVGHCGIAKYKDELTAFFGSFNGVTKYQDEFTHYNVHCPIYSARKKIGKDIAVINNNSIRNAVYPLIHHYATLLGHNEVTLIDTLIAARDSGGVPIANTEKQRQSIANYQSKIFNGQYGVVTDPACLGIEYAGSDRHTQQTVTDLYDVRAKLLKSFYSDIGVRSAFEKRSNSVEAEVEADTSLLLLNLSDMLDSRKKGAEEVNRLYGTNWDVHIAEEIDYNAENEVVNNDNSEADV